MTGLRVFLAEDNDDLAALVTKRLTAQDWSVVRAKTADEAASRLRGDRFDAVVLDYQFPDGDGLHLLPIVRESSPDTPVLFLTAHGSEDIALQALGLGATDYMQKSGTMLEELPRRIAGMLSRDVDNKEGSRVVTIREARPRTPAATPGAAVPGGAPPIEQAEARALLESFVSSYGSVDPSSPRTATRGNDVIGAALFDGAGASIAALLPAGLDATVLGASLLQIHAQVGIIGRLNHLAPRAYAFTMETEHGTLACTTVGGRALVAVLVKPGSTHVHDRLQSLAARVR